MADRVSHSRSVSTCALLLLLACQVSNPAYDPTRVVRDGGTQAMDGAEALDDALQEPDVDAGEFTGTDTFVVMDAPVLTFDTAKPPDTAGLMLDVSPPSDAALSPRDVALPPPDAAVAPPDAAVAPPDAALSPDDESQTPQSCAPDPSLVLCMAFEDKVVDQSGLGSDFETSSLAFEAGPMGKALVSTAATRIANVSLTTAAVPSVTIQAWIKPSRLPSLGRRFGIVDYQPQYSMFILSDGQITCSCDDTRRIETPPLIKVDVWQSVACTIDEQAITIWVNGYPRAQVANDRLCQPAVTVTGLAVLGNIVLGGSPYPDSFEGLADNVRVWGRTRTAAEICRDAWECAP